MKKSAVYFDKIEEKIKQHLLQAERSVQICVAWFNYSAYESVINTLRNRGVSVELVCNRDQHSEGIRVEDFDGLYRVKSYLRWGLMHHKFCVIDYKTIITGSYNWSKNAVNHLENIIVLNEDLEAVKAYLHEFEDMKMLNDSYKEYRLKKESYHKCQYRNHLNSRHCNSTLINIIVGSLDESRHPRFGLWEVCLKNNHAILIEEYLETIINDEPNYDREYDYYDVQEMLTEFDEERRVIQHNLFHHSFLRKYPVHALAYVEVLNWGEYLKYDYPKEFNIKVYWRNILYRKDISESMNVYNIIQWAQKT